MFTFANKIVVLASAVAALATFAAPVAAETVSIAVSYADLNLANPSGVAAFNSRITRAVTNMCGDGTSGLSARTAMVRCRTEALNSAKSQVSRVVADASRADQRVILASR